MLARLLAAMACLRKPSASLPRSFRELPPTPFCFRELPRTAASPGAQAPESALRSELVLECFLDMYVCPKLIRTVSDAYPDAYPQMHVPMQTLMRTLRQPYACALLVVYVSYCGAGGSIESDPSRPMPKVSAQASWERATEGSCGKSE